MNLLASRDMEFIMILTVGRSGSTLLQGILNTFPGFLIRGENKGFLLNLQRAYQSIEYSKRMASSSSTPTDPWFGAEVLDLDRLLDDFSTLTIRQLTGVENLAHVDVLGIKEIRWLEKDMGSITVADHVAFIQKLFPRSKFIFLTRDIDQILASAWWPLFDADLIRKQISDFYDAVRKLSGDSLFEIDYSDLRPGSNRLLKLAEFLGQEYMDAIDVTCSVMHSYPTPGKTPGLFGAK